MKIKVLGTGCASCKTLMTNVQKTVEELNLDAEVEKVEDMMQILSYNVMSLPALVIDDKVVAKGNVPLKEVKKILMR